LSDVYEIVPVGVEDLGTRWVQEGEVDSIVTVCTFSSIPISFVKYMSFGTCALESLVESFS